MMDALTWLCGLDGLRFGSEGVSLGLARPISTWAWLAVVLAAAGLALWSYRRLAGNRRGRGALALVRVGAARPLSRSGEANPIRPRPRNG